MIGQQELTTPSEPTAAGNALRKLLDTSVSDAERQSDSKHVQHMSSISIS